jgi:hypothetical protein
MHIVLRKIGGRLTPLWQRDGSASGGVITGGAATVSLTGLFLGLVLLIVVLAALAWLFAHGHAASPFALAGVMGLTGDSPLLKEKRETLAVKAKLWSEADTLSLAEGGKRDMSRKELLDKLQVPDAASAKSAIDSLYLEITDLNQEIDDLAYKQQKSDIAAIGEELRKPVRQMLPSSHIRNEPQTFGQMAVDAKGFMEGIREKRYPSRAEVDVDIKTLLQTSAGFQPRTGNGDRIIDKIIRPVQILDLIPTDSTELFEIPFMTETTRTQNAAEIAEGGTYAEDAFVFTRSASAVRKVGSQIPATDEQLADVGVMRSLLDNRLRFGVQARLDQQIMVGDGIAPNLQGVFTVSGIQTQAKGADSTANAIFKAMTLVRITGRAVPDLIAMHGTDWANVRLAQNAQGDYQFGPPTMVGADTMWGLPVAQTEALTAGNAVVGAFSTYSQLYYRKGIEVQVGFINTQFIEGKVTLRADARVAFVIYRGAAFAKVTGL